MSGAPHAPICVLLDRSKRASPLPCAQRHALGLWRKYYASKFRRGAMVQISTRSIFASVCPIHSQPAPVLTITLFTPEVSPAAGDPQKASSRGCCAMASTLLVLLATARLLPTPTPRRSQPAHRPSRGALLQVCSAVYQCAVQQGLHTRMAVGGTFGPDFIARRRFAEAPASSARHARLKKTRHKWCAASDAGTS
jgi:hypothetical protein